MVFDLRFRVPKQEDLPGPPHAQIYVKLSGTSDEGLTTLGADCVTFEELDGQIAYLEQELARLRKTGKKRFETWKKKANQSMEGTK